MVTVRHLVDRWQIDFKILLLLILNRVLYLFTVSIWHGYGENNLENVLLQ